MVGGCDRQPSPPRIPRWAARPPDFALYTDASSKSNMIAALLIRGATKHPDALELSKSAAHRFCLNRFNRQDVISGLEMLAPLDFLWANRKKISHSSTNLYIDNNNVHTSLVRGDSGADIIAAAIALFWMIAESHSIDIWIGRVSSKNNPDGIPTRNVPLPCKILKKTGLSEISNYYRWRVNGGLF